MSIKSSALKFETGIHNIFTLQQNFASLQHCTRMKLQNARHNDLFKWKLLLNFAPTLNTVHGDLQFSILRQRQDFVERFPTGCVGRF